MAKDVLKDVDEGVIISFKIPKKLLDKLDGKPLLLLNIQTGEAIPGGLVVNETLSLPEQERFCKVGMEIEPATGGLARRIKALREAGVRFA